MVQKPTLPSHIVYGETMTCVLFVIKIQDKSICCFYLVVLLSGPEANAAKPYRLWRNNDLRIICYKKSRQVDSLF